MNYENELWREIAELVGATPAYADGNARLLEKILAAIRGE
jgi:hypothetical protein